VERLGETSPPSLLSYVGDQLLGVAVRDDQDVQFGEDHAKSKERTEQQRIHHPSAVLEQLDQAVRALQRTLRGGGSRLRSGQGPPKHPGRNCRLCWSDCNVRRRFQGVNYTTRYFFRAIRRVPRSSPARGSTAAPAAAPDPPRAPDA